MSVFLMAILVIPLVQAIWRRGIWLPGMCISFGIDYIVCGHPANSEHCANVLWIRHPEWLR